MNKAYSTLKKFTLDYIKSNWEALTERYDGLEKSDLTHIRKNRYDVFEWILDNICAYEFKDMGIIKQYEWHGDTFHAIVQVGKKYVRQTITYDSNNNPIYQYEFVKLVKKKVIVETFEPVK